MWKSVTIRQFYDFHKCIVLFTWRSPYCQQIPACFLNVVLLPPSLPQQMYIAEVLQDPEEAASGSSEDEGQGPSRDEEARRAENSMTGDFQSCEDSLIENEIRQWKPAGREGERPDRTRRVHWLKGRAELCFLSSAHWGTSHRLTRARFLPRATWTGFGRSFPLLWKSVNTKKSPSFRSKPSRGSPICCRRTRPGESKKKNKKKPRFLQGKDGVCMPKTLLHLKEKKTTSKLEFH